MQGFFSVILPIMMLVREGMLTEMEEVEELLNMESAIDLKNAEGLILLIGSSGTGKSTLAKFLTNDPSLYMVKVGSSNYVYRDNGSISTNIRKSMTLLPNVYQDPQTNEVIVDCPGFSDTREPKYEIANAFFIKKVLEYPQKLKIIVTENHFSLLEGSDRFGFSRLLLALAELIPHIERFQGSIAFVGTKASLRGNPEDVKTDLLEFLSNYKKDLQEDLNSKANNTVQGMIKVLDVLTGHPPGKDVAFFWKPTITKTHQSIEDMMIDCKNNIRSILFNELTWANNTNVVYHYSLSKESKLFIRHELAPSTVANTSDELVTFFENIKSGAQSIIRSVNSSEELVDFMGILHNELSFVSNVTLMSVQDISYVTQQLATVTDVEEFNADAFKNLASKAGFFKSFGVDVVQQLNRVMHSQLKSMQVWVSENLQNAIRLQEVHEQTKEAKIALENASKAAKEAEERNAQALADVKIELHNKSQEASAQVAAIESARKAAEEKARQTEQDLKDSIEELRESSEMHLELLRNRNEPSQPNNDFGSIAKKVAGAFFPLINLF